MNDLATLTKNTVRMEATEVTLEQYARAAELQQRTLDLLEVPVRLQYDVTSTAHRPILRKARHSARQQRSLKR